jgi:ABC-type branched-subunit amino acid transport system substrate-binding protein
MLTSGVAGASKPAAKATGTPYNVALIADLVGAAATIEGLSSSAGLTAALKTITDSGGAAGHPLKLTVFDAQSTVDGVQAAARSAIALKPNVIVVATLSGEVNAILPLLQQAQIPVLSVAPVAARLFPTPTPWFFTIADSTNQIGEYLYQEATVVAGGNLNKKRIALELLVSANVDAFAKELKLRAQAKGAQFVSEQKRDNASTTFTSGAQNIVDSKPDMVIVIDGEAGGNIAVAALKTAGYTGPIIVSSGVATAAFFKNNATSQIRAVRVYRDVSETPVVVKALKKYQQDTTGAFINYTWSAGYVLKEAFSTCVAPCSSPALIKALETMKPVTPLGGTTYGPAGFTADKHYLVNSVQFYSASSPTAKVKPIGSALDVANTPLLGG